MASMIKKSNNRKKKNRTGQMNILVHKFPFLSMIHFSAIKDGVIVMLSGKMIF